jgi:hypothetical protein
MDVVIRRAKENEAEYLTKLTMDSQEDMEHPDTWMDLWEEELTVDKDYIKNNQVYIAEYEGVAVAYYSICDDAGEYYLDSLYMKATESVEGLGKLLFDHMSVVMKDNGIQKITIISDPQAVSFYLFMGAKLTSEIPSELEGQMLPVLEFTAV